MVEGRGRGGWVNCEVGREGGGGVGGAGGGDRVRSMNL